MKLELRGCGHCGATFYAASNQETCPCGSGPNILGTEKIGLEKQKTSKFILYCVLAPLMLISLILAPMFDYDI